MLRLEAQDLLHLRHVPRRRGTSGGETPERSPEAGDVNAAPPLNSKGGAGRGSLRSARGGRGGLRGASSRSKHKMNAVGASAFIGIIAFK